MSDHPTHPESATALDAQVDALAAELGVTTTDARGAAHASTATLDAPPSPSPPAAHPTESASPDTLLSEISDEIERTAPGTLPTPPEPPASTYAPPAPLPTDDDIAAASAEVDADLNAFEPPRASEIAPPLAPTPAPVAIQPAAPAAGPIASTPTAERPGAEIQRLDAALAASAERALLSAKREEPKPAPPPEPIVVAEPEPEFEPELPSAPLEPIVVAPAPVAKHDPAPAPIQEPLAEQMAAPAPSRLRILLAKALTLPLRPIAALHEKLAEPTRQTIAYCAIITLFFAACVWGRVIFFPAKSNLEPHGEPAEFYDDTKPAHGITAPTRHAPEGAAGHGDSGHGEAKKPDAHAKPEKKSSGGHGDEAHAKPAKKPSARAKKNASADAHGGH